MVLDVKLKKKLEHFSIDLEFQAEEGECLGILGASGCGKSMTLKMLAGIEQPDFGTIYYNGSVYLDTSKKINQKPRNRRIGYLFQNYALFPNMTVRENIGAGLRLPKAEKEKKLKEMLSRFHLEMLENSYPNRLSGGQQQRTALARLLAYEPDILLLDEPFSALDSFLKEKLLLELSQTLKEFGGMAILVTHNRDEVFQLSQKLAVMEQGRFCSSGSTKALFQTPKNVPAAKMTGCKNISRVKKIGDYKVLAQDWGVTLTTASPVTDSISHIGIRAHDFSPFRGSVQERIKKENIIHLMGPRISEAPFEWNVIFQSGLVNGNGLLPDIWWKFSKGSIQDSSNIQIPEYLEIKPEGILLLEEE